MNDSTRKQLYTAVWNAREACGGGNVQPKQTIQQLVGKAFSMTFGKPHYKTVRNKLEHAMKIIEDSKTYYDRLPADDILCEILRTDLEG